MKVPPFDAEAVRALATILAETGLTEIEIEGKDGRIRVARAPAIIMAPVHAAPAGPPPQAAAAPAVVVKPADDAQHPGAVLSPMVGVAFLAPEPGAAAYITLGQAVVAGQTLLLIEAMKTFNQIRAPKSGTIMRILVESGQPVEYGQPLLIVE